VVYIPGDIDRSFWQIMNTDHGKLLGNAIKWAMNEDPVAIVEGPGVIDVTVWEQKSSVTVHLVNLTNPMMMKGPFREFIPVTTKVHINIPGNKKVTGVHLLMANQSPKFEMKNGALVLEIPKIVDHEILA